MFSSFLLSLREGLEAALIIGIVLGALRKMGRLELNRIVWLGVGSAAALCILVAFVLNRFGAGLEGRAEEIFEGIAMLSAAILLTWMIFWMHRQAHALRQKLETDVRRSVFHSGRMALFALAFISVGREGLELAIFLVATQIAAGSWAIYSGAALGLIIAALLGWLIFSGTHRLSLNQFFKATNIILILFAAGLVAHGVHELNEAGLIPPIIDHVWDVNFVLNENSVVGQFLKTLVGYNGNPSLTEVLAFMGYFVFIYFGLRWVSTARFAISSAN